MGSSGLTLIVNTVTSESYISVTFSLEN